MNPRSRQNRARAVCLALLCVLATGGSSAAAPASLGGSAFLLAPERATVRISVTPGSGYADSGLIRRGRAAWFATAVATAAQLNTIRVYRWSGAAWSLEGVVRVPQTPSLTSGGDLRAARLTHSGAPDFTLSTFGADTHWFAVISRIRGAWRTVPFDYRRGPRVGIDAWGVQSSLVRAEANGCGCAAGPETYSWYRFDGRMFVPTEPPGPAAECSADALDRARPLVVGRALDVAVQGKLDAPFAVSRFACADGWALATAAKGGKRRLALFEQRAGAWLRDAVGPARAIRGHAHEFALPNSLLWQLATRIGEPFGRRPSAGHEESYALDRADLGREPRWEHAPLRITTAPGSTYADSRVVYRRGRKWLAVAVEAKPGAAGRRHSVTLHVYRWTRTSWTRQGTVHVEVATVHREDPLHFVSPESLTGSADPDFTVGPSVPFPSWLAVISDVSGRWRTVPFHEGPRVSVVAVEASRVSGRVVESYASPSRKIRYRFRRGTFEPLRRREPAAPCNPHLFGLLARPPIRVARAACAYGWALAAGKRKGRSVVAGFEELGTSWSWLETVRARQIDSFEYIDGMPEWLLKRLARRVGASG